MGALLEVLLPGRADTPDARRELQQLLRAHAAALDPAPERQAGVDKVPIAAPEAAAAALHRRPEQATTEVADHEVPIAAMEAVTVAAAATASASSAAVAAADAFDRAFRLAISSREAASDDVVNSEVPIAAETTATAADNAVAADDASRSAHPPHPAAAAPPKAKFSKPPKARKNKEFDFSKYPQRHVALQVMYAGWDYRGFASQGMAMASCLFAHSSLVHICTLFLLLLLLPSLLLLLLLLLLLQ